MITPARRLRRSSSSRTAIASRAAHRRRRVSGAAAGSIGAAGFATAIARDLHRLGARERRRAAAGGSGGRRGRRRPPRRRSATSSTNVDVALDVAGDAEAAEHLLAEAVGGGDRRRVEVGQRAREPLAPRAGPPPRGPSASSRDDLVASLGAAPASAALERLLGADEPLAHAVAQLAGRHARERDEQQLVERRALGDVARRERGDRVRLAGAGARLEHGDAGRQRAADVERLRSLTGRSPPRRCSSPSHSRRA